MDDYNYLNQYLDENFIPNNLKSRKNGSQNYKNEFVEYVQLSSIEHLNLNDEEFDYVMKYLDNQGISVIGNSPALYSDYPNYYYTTRPFAIPNSISLTIEEQKDYIKKYQKDHNIEDRNKIVEAYYNLVKNIAYDYSYTTGIENDDLITAGFIGLMKAIEQVDVEKNFCNYFRVYIVRNIVDEIKKIQGLYNNGKQTFAYRALLKSKNKLLNEYQFEDNYDEYEHLDEILSDLESGNLTTNKNEIRRVAMAYAKSLDDIVDNEDLVSDGIEDQVIERLYQYQAKQELEKGLEKLESHQREVIMKYYFEEQTLSQIAKIYEVTDRAVDNCKKRGFKNMRRQADLYRFYNK